MDARKKIYYFSIDLSNSFGETLLKGIMNRCRYYDYDCLAVNGGTLGCQYKWEHQRNILYKMIKQDKMDALIVANIFSLVSKSIAYNFLDPFKGIPVVTLCEKFPGIPAVRIDNTAGFRSLLDHLIRNCGSRSFALITGPKDNFDSIERLDVFRKVLSESNIKIDPGNIYTGDFSGISALAGIRALLDERKISFDTLVCFNDLMAITAMEELKRRGYRIPGDIKITGFDNTYGSGYTNPSLTTVNNPAAGLGETAVNIIYNLLTGQPVKDLTILPSRFVPRLSCGAGAIKQTIEPDNIFLIDGKKYFPGPDLIVNIKKEIHENVLRGTGSFPDEKHTEWFISKLDEIIREIFLNRIHEAGIPEFLDRAIYSDYSNEWSSDLWVSVFKLIEGFVRRVPEGASFLVPASMMLSIGELYKSRYAVNKFLITEVKEKYLLQLGEELGTTFDLNAMASVIKKYAGFIGIDSCFVFQYTNPSMKNAYQLVRIENKKCKDSDKYKKFPSHQIFSDELWDIHHSYVLDALHVKNEQIGYILINAADHPGMIYESLRHQFSAAIKEALMVGTINRYSEGLEKMVEERTKILSRINKELKDEIKRRETAENELLKQKNLESLGLLAGGISHDFNNILTILIGNVSLLQMDDSDPEYRQNSYELIIKTIENAKNLTQQLLTFSKGGIPIKKPMQIKPLIEEVAKFILHGSKVKPVFDFAAKTGNIEIDQDQISQVLNNLILNSLQAMPEGGTITFRVRQVRLKKDRMHCPAGEYTIISIADTGSGIPRGIIDRIFDPYFTTKDRGSGLGLATSLNIVRKHGGDIIVSSAEGEGTVFDIYLPVSRKSVEIKSDKKYSFIPQGLKVLVLEDDAMVAEIFRKFLVKSGEECTMTSDGSQTIRLYMERKKINDPFDLVITDLTIPGGMGGLEVMKILRETDPSVKGIVSSGYSDVPVMANYHHYGFKSFLRKPFSYNEFKNAVYEALK